jgi:hypothetical protein
MDTEMTFSCVADGGFGCEFTQESVFFGTFPSFAIFKGRGFVIFRTPWGPIGIEFTEVKRAGAIGASGEAIPAPDAFFVVYVNNPVFSFPRGVDGADGNTGGDVALHTGAGNEASAHIGIGSDFFVQNGAIHDAGWKFVLGDASHRASMTPHTLP